MNSSFKSRRNDRSKVSDSESGPISTGIAAVLLDDSPFEMVMGQAVALYHRLRVAAEQIHRQGEMTSGKGGVLAGLYRFGSQTVPQMARARPVSRQYIQTLVNMLADDGLVEFIENPAHKRSHLVCLTKKGEELIEKMINRQKRLLSRINVGIPERDLIRAAEILRDLREFFEGEKWEKMLKQISN